MVSSPSFSMKIWRRRREKIVEWQLVTRSDDAKQAFCAHLRSIDHCYSGSITSTTSIIVIIIIALLPHLE